MQSTGRGTTSIQALTDRQQAYNERRVNRCSTQQEVASATGVLAAGGQLPDSDGRWSWGRYVRETAFNSQQSVTQATGRPVRDSRG